MIAIKAAAGAYLRAFCSVSESSMRSPIKRKKPLVMNVTTVKPRITAQISKELKSRPFPFW